MDLSDSNPAHLFVLGTGRCGTKTLARMLSQIPGCSVIHEHTPPLLKEVTDRVRGGMDADAMTRLLGHTRHPDVLGGDRVSGESNQRLSFVLPELASAFPECRFLWMIRDGRANVASVFHRRWYDPREARLREPHHAPSARNRLCAPDVGDMERAEWDRLDGFARCCWYWSYTNRTIESESKRLGVPTLKIRLEDLGGRIDELLPFLGLPPETETELRTWNSARQGSPLATQHWPYAWRASFESICGPLMDEHYPGWQDDGWSDRSGFIAGTAARWRYNTKRGWSALRVRFARRMMPN